MAVRMIRNSWWVDLRFNHTRYRRRSPENSRAGALSYEAMLRHKLICGESIHGVAPAVRQKQMFEQFARQWFDQYVTVNNKPSEQRTKKYILSASLVPFFGGLRVDEVTPHYIEKYKAQLLQENVTRKTVNNRLTVLSKCIATAYEWLELEGTPPRIKLLRCDPPKMDFLSQDESESLLFHAHGIIREMILTALRTGMRQGELKGLQWSSINWETGVIAVQYSWCDRAKALGSPKSNRVRHIPMTADLHEMLLRRRKDTGFIFLDRHGRPFDHYRLGSALEDVRKKAGLRHIGWHTLRHTFASHLAMKGAPVTAIQSLMGHSSITTTMRYMHLAPSTLRAAVEMLNPAGAQNGKFGQPVGNAWREALGKESA
jgi:integrase